MKNPMALIIDDEPDIRELLGITLNRMNMECHFAEDLSQARSLLKKHQFDVCLTDMRLPDGDGVSFVSYVQQNYPTLPIAVITAYGNMEAAIQALKSGAFDFLSKPVDLNVLRNIIKSAVNLSSGEFSTQREFVGNSNAAQSIRQAIAKLSRSQAPVYISGESGTGKELVARMIHEQGSRSEQPFIPVNCGAIPADLIESELFGHKRGSFTGATSDKDGLFQAAEGGTLFLDEIAELPMQMQVKLLRAIQEKTVRPIGANQEIAIDVRILSATHADLTELVKANRFRQDLYYRINVIELHIPPLRDRREDLPLLINHILGKIALKSGIDIARISKSAMEKLQDYHYPGNFRELENILERATILSEGREIECDDLQITRLGVANSEQTVTDSDASALNEYLGDIERKTILEALEKNRWNRTAAAKSLGISVRALRYRLEKLGLDKKPG